MQIRSLHSSLFRDAKRMMGYLRAALLDPRGFRKAASNMMARRAQAKAILLQARQISDLPLVKIQVGGPHIAEEFLAALAQHFAILELRSSHDLLQIGIRDADLLPILQLLKRSYPHLNLEPFDNASCRRIIAQSKFSLNFPRPSGERPFLLLVEPYALDAQNRWNSRNSRNQIMRAVYGSEFDKPGLSRAKDILGAPLLSQRHETKPVDAVFTWVDHNDPEWQDLYHYHRPPITGEASIETGGDAASATRFHNNDELRYALRSIWLNLPWINHIHVFSNCPPPVWLDTEHLGISWVRHEEVIPAEFLPTFNSHVIESYLHRIPNLKENFLYLNDDFFIMRPLQPNAFFTLAGQSLVRFEGYGMVSGPVRDQDPDYLNAARNSQALLVSHLNFAATELHSHVPYALLRSTLLEIESCFAEPIKAFRGNRFRTPQDLNIPSFLYHHYAMAVGRALPRKTSGILVKCNSFSWRDRLAKASRKRQDFVCINEGGTEAPPPGWHEEVRRHLELWFPNPAPWEG